MTIFEKSASSRTVSASAEVSANRLETKAAVSDRIKVGCGGGSRIQNTTISALITLREVKIGAARLAEYVQEHDEAAYTFDPALHARLKVDESHFGVIVWENAFAATPLPGGLFRGPYDEYWSAKPDGGGNARTHVGEKLQWTLDRYPDGVSPFEAIDAEYPRDGSDH